MYIYKYMCVCLSFKNQSMYIEIIVKEKKDINLTMGKHRRSCRRVTRSGFWREESALIVLKYLKKPHVHIISCVSTNSNVFYYDNTDNILLSQRITNYGNFLS